MRLGLSNLVALPGIFNCRATIFSLTARQICSYCANRLKLDIQVSKVKARTVGFDEFAARPDAIAH
jgi:hypothetical protein